MHDWSDDRFDWKGLDDAISIIEKRFKRARISVFQYKEKYGTARVYMNRLGWGSLHDFFYPGYCSSQWRKWWNSWLWYADCKYGRYLMRLINKIVVPWHMRVYRAAYEEAVKAHPHLSVEILIMADYQELIEGIAGYKHDEHWTTCTND